MADFPKPQPEPEPEHQPEMTVERVSPLSCPFCSHEVAFIIDPYQQTTFEFPTRPCWAHNPEVIQNLHKIGHSASHIAPPITSSLQEISPSRGEKG